MRRVALEAESKAAERLRKERQREEGRKAAELRQRQEDEAESTELLHAQLVSRGFDIEPKDVKPILDRYAQKRDQQVTRRALSEISDAFSAAAAEIVGAEYDGDLTPAASQYLSTFKPFIDQVIQHPSVRDKLVADARKEWEKELPKLVDAEIVRRGAKSREGKTNLNRVDGTASVVDRSEDARKQRLAFGGADDDDRQWFKKRFPQ